MRIVIDCRCVFDGCGGIGNYTRSLVQALGKVNSRDEVTLLHSSARPWHPILDQPNARSLPVPAAMLDGDWEQFELPVLLEELGAHLYHNPTFALPIVSPCPLVTTIHDVVFHYRPDLVEPGLCRYLQQAAATASRVATRIITVSEYSRQSIASAYGIDPEAIDVIYEAADLQRFCRKYGGALEDEFRAKHRLRGPFVLYVGSLEPKKNIDRLLAAFGAIRDSIPHQLVLAGGTGGMPYDVHEAISELRLEDRVTVTGFIPDALLPVAYNAADVFVYPSLYEGFGLPPLEAMACGVPTVVSTATSLPEVVGDAAVMVDPLDVDALAAALLRVTTDEKLRAELAIAGPARAAEFSWQRAALQTMQCYLKAIGVVTALPAY
jgi:glycosyltransferase involved in cell wall biosynthesis